MMTGMELVIPNLALVPTQSLHSTGTAGRAARRLQGTRHASRDQDITIFSCISPWLSAPSVAISEAQAFEPAATETHQAGSTTQKATIGPDTQY